MSAFAPVLANVRILLVGLRQGAVADHTKEKTLTFTKVRARIGGSYGPDLNQRDRKSTQGFQKRRRTESGGRVRPGR
jgi:ribosomal protein L34